MGDRLTMMRCVCCGGDLRPEGDLIYCVNGDCPKSTEGYFRSAGQPVLIAFDASIFQPNATAKRGDAEIVRDTAGTSFKTRLRRFVFGSNRAAKANADRMLAMVKALSPTPTILVVGGGAVGSGAAGLYTDPGVEILGTDVYPSNFTKVVSDAHHLPFKDQMFEGVWIQAVLEHVLDPRDVAAEIHRVLRPGGVVYADTPFMQQVHEGAYDFTRFTLSGQRWLFRDFEHLASGPVSGAGTATLWSIRYLLRAVGLPEVVATVLILPLFWLRFLDGLGSRRNQADAACGVFFLGRRADQPIGPKAMVAYYDAI